MRILRGIRSYLGEVVSVVQELFDDQPYLCGCTDTWVCIDCSLTGDTGHVA